MTDMNDTLDGKSVQLIRLADGTLIDPLTRAPLNVPSAKKPSAERREQSEPETDDEEEDDDTDEAMGRMDVRPVHRRSLMEFALTAPQMAMINNVLVYTLYGLPDDEVALMCNCTVHNVHVVRDLDDYQRMYDALIDGLRAAYGATVQGILHDAAPVAARSIVKKMKNKSQDISMAAIKDVLDRAGHRPADRVEHTHMFGDGSELVIRVIRESEKEEIPTLELEANA